MPRTWINARGRPAARVAAAGLLMAAIVLVDVGGVSAAGNTFTSQWADVAASGRNGSSTWKVTMSPGQDEFNGQVTEYLKTKITTSHCKKGYLYETTLEKAEEARDLKGVQVQALSGTASVSRRTTVGGVQTKAASKDCVTRTGAPATQTVSYDIVLRGTWSKSGAAVTYSGNDCGESGRCTYFDAGARGTVIYDGDSLDPGARGSKAWLWSGTWDLSA